MPLQSTPDYNAARQELVGWLETARTAAQSALGWSALPPLDADNRGVVDLTADEAIKPHLAYEIIWMPAHPASLGLQPIVRQYGQMVVSAKVKVGAGTADSLQLIGKIVPYLQLKDGTYVHSLVAELHQAREVLGWHYQPVLLNFYMDYLHNAL